jgi:hypothetical protein
MKVNKARSVSEELPRGFSVHTYFHPLTQKWHVELKDPLGNPVELLQTIREDCIAKNQLRIRERMARWFPEESAEERDLYKQLERERRRQV